MGRRWGQRLDDSRFGGAAQRLRSWNSRLNHGVDRWMFFFVAVLMLVIAPFVWPGVIAAARNEGDPGTFTAVKKDCQPKGGCAWDGTFTTDSGRVVKGVIFDAGSLNAPGDTARGQYVHGETDIFDTHDHQWIFWGAADAASAGYLLWWFLTGRKRKH